MGYLVAVSAMAVNTYSYGLSCGCKHLQPMGYLVAVNTYSYGLSYGCKHLQLWFILWL